MNAHAHGWIAAIAAALLVVSCSGKPPKDPQAIDRLRIDAERLIREQSIMSYNSWVFGTPTNSDSLYRAHPGLFTREQIERVRQAEAEETDPVQKQRLRYLERYLVLEFLSQATAPLADRINAGEAHAIVHVGSDSIPYRQIAVLLANEERPQRRAALYSATDPVLDSLNINRTALWKKYYTLAQELGFHSYRAMIEELKGIPLDSMRADAREILATTDSLYRALLAQILGSEAGLDTAHFYRYDTPRLFRASRFDRYYPRTGTVATARALYGPLGITLDSLRNIAIDASDRPAKNPRAVCYAIDIPSDIRLSIKPIGGPDDYAALFHELGHALHAAHNAEHAMEFKYLGEYTVTETFAFLSEYMLLNQAWLRQQSRMPVAALKDFVRLQAFHRLYFIRRYCGKLLYELDLHDGASRPDELYASILSGAVGHRSLPSDRKRYLDDVDEHFYTATYLRGWLLQAQLNRYLTRTYGVNWYESPDAGAFLKSLWARGDRLQGEDLAALIGETSINPGALLDEIHDMLRFSSR